MQEVQARMDAALREEAVAMPEVQDVQVG